MKTETNNKELNGDYPCGCAYGGDFCLRNLKQKH